MVHRGLLKEHVCKKKYQNICSEAAINAYFNFSHHKSMETISCLSNQSSYLTGKKKKKKKKKKKNNLSFHMPIDAICGIW